MPVHLRTRHQAVGVQEGVHWLAVDAGPAPLPIETKLEPGQALERAFLAQVPQFLALCRDLAAVPSAVLAHTPSAAVNASDMGVMMAWTHLVEGWAAGAELILVLCDDPWLYRHLAALPGVEAGPLPPLWPVRTRLAVRGLIARTAYAIGAFRRALAHPPHVTSGGKWLLGYHHPGNHDGEDAYFGPLTRQIPGLSRVRHVDGPVGEEGRPVLSRWGSAWTALGLAFARWRPTARQREGRWGWLVYRAAAREGGTAQAAAIAWQIHCQQAWLRAVRPKSVAWPWEGHGWERALCRQTKVLGVRSLGYQHATIGRTEFNYHPATLADPASDLPDRVLCVGEVARSQLEAWGVPSARLAVGGALRYGCETAPAHDPAAPIFAALPADAGLARQLAAAAAAAAHATGHRLLVRPHPVYDVPVAEDALVIRAQAGLSAEPSLSAVVYAATTVGLEAVLAGLPTIRFVPHGCIALDILPNNIDVPAADCEGLAAALQAALPPPLLRREDVFAPVDLAVWRAAFES